MSLIFKETCEKPPIFPLNKVHNVENCNGSRVADNISDGGYAKTAFWTGDSMQVEVWKKMPGVGSAKKPRSEVVIKDPVSKESWYAESMFFPSDGTENDKDNRDCINQWWRTGDKESTIRMQQGKAFYEFELDGIRLDLFGSGGSQAISSMNDIIRDKWVHFVFHFIHSVGSDGLVEIWRDGVKIHTYSGPNMQTAAYPKWKVGLYKSNMESSAFPYRRMRFKNVFYGDKTATLADMLIGDVISTGPTVNAGGDKTVTGTAVTITGKVTGSIVSYLWKQTAGPVVAVLTGTGSPALTVTELIEGVYKFNLTVTDDKGLTATDTATITVSTASTNDSMVFVLIGDQGKDTAAQAKVASTFKTYNPDFIVTSGDNSYDDFTTALAKNNVGKHYGDFIVAKNFFPVAGNHDWHTGLGDYLNYFPYLPKNAAGNSSYYDFVKGNVHFFMLDSNDEQMDGNNVSSKQAAYIKVKMLASTAKFKVVIFHHGAYCSSTKHGSATRMRWKFEDLGANVVFSGHNHVYEVVQVNGIPYITNGLGGNDLNSFGSPITGSVFRYNGTNGFNLIEVTDTSMTIKLINMNNVLVHTVVIGSPAINIPPVANAGADKTITLPVSNIALVGDASTDRDGTIAKYSWTKVSGGSAVIVSPDAKNTEVNTLSQGGYVFRLTVTDDIGATAFDDVAITVKERVNTAPEVSAGSDISTDQTTVKLSGTAIDRDGSIVSVIWSKVSGGAFSIDNPAILTPTLSGLQVGPYVFRIDATDNEGEDTFDEVAINITEDIVITYAGPDQQKTIVENFVILDGRNSLFAVAFEWLQVSGPTCVIESHNSAVTKVTGLQQAVYTFELATVDIKGVRTTDQVTITAKNGGVGNVIPASYEVVGNLLVIPKFPDGSQGESVVINI